MDLVTLDENYQQHKLIQNYDSLIWTERYTIGDFVITTGDPSFLEQLPRGTVLSLRESTVPMVVERHIVERKKNQAASFQIIGREFTKVLGQRAAVQSVTGALDEWSVVAKQPSDVAHFIIHKVCVEGVCDVKDIFPSSQVQIIAPTDYLEASRPNRQFTVARGNLLSAVVQLLQTEAGPEPDTIPPSPKVDAHGIRAMRPNSAGTAIGIQIYKGVDRRLDIRFETFRDAFDDGTYVFADENYATNAYVLGPEGAYKLHKGDSDLSGLDRRVILVDGGTSGVTNADALKTEGTAALSRAHQIARFDGTLNPELSPYRYNVDYGLGDIVMTVGDYGLVTPARVTEYIRSEDSNGRRSFPTLVSIEQETDL